MPLGGKSESDSTGFNLDSSFNTELGVQGGDGTVVRDGNVIDIVKNITTNTLDGGAIKAAFALGGNIVSANEATTKNAFDVSQHFIDTSAAQSMSVFDSALSLVEDQIAPDRKTTNLMMYGVFGLAGLGILVAGLAMVKGGT